MLKDLRYTLGLTGRNGFRIALYTFLICAAATAILLYLRITNNWSDYMRGLQGWMLLRAAFMPLIVVAFCVPLIHNEKTYRTLDALRSTLLTPTEILKGKLLTMTTVCGAFVVTALAADLPHLLIGSYAGGNKGIMLLTGAGTLLTTMFLALGISMACAVYIKDRNTALAVSMILTFCFLFGNYWIIRYLIDPAIYYFINGGIDSGYYVPRGTAHWRAKLSPIVALYNQIDSIRYNRTHYNTWASAMVMYGIISAALITVSFQGYKKRMT